MRLSEEGEAADLGQTGQSEKYTDGLHHSPTCPGLVHVFTGYPSKSRDSERTCVHWFARGSSRDGAQHHLLVLPPGKPGKQELARG